MRYPSATMELARIKIPLLAVALLVSVLFASPAYAADVDQLGVNYRMAVQAYEDAVVEQEQNAGEISEISAEIEQTEASLAHSREQLGDTAVSLYKESCGHSPLLELVLESSSFSEAVARYDLYTRVQRYYAERAQGFASEQAQLSSRRDELEARKLEIESKVAQAKQAADDAETALLQATHSDGDKYHQVQGNGANCGATAFTVGLNILLHEERFTDNVKVWEGAGFKRDSTNNLALRARAWLLANDLADEVGVEEVAGDIHKADELRKQLEKGNVVIISSGPSSVWQRADGTETAPDVFPNGHWIVFYHYEEGFFLANDSSVLASKGAGCAYDEKQMQQWLDGRANHFATIMYKK